METQSGLGGILFLFFVLALIGLYFLPRIIALARGKRNGRAIFVLNLLLGWSFVGWVIALVWSMAHEGVDRR